MYLVKGLSSEASAEAPKNKVPPPSSLLDYHGLCMDDAWIMHGSCMDYAWIMHGLCMDYAWIMYGLCMDYAWMMHGSYMDHAWIMHGLCMDDVWRGRGQHITDRPQTTSHNYLKALRVPNRARTLTRA